MMPRPHAAVLATDLDRTFTTPELRLDPAALLAARSLRRRGIRLVLATGRPQALLPELQVLEPLFDGFIVEGGAMWGRPGGWTLPARHTAGVHGLAAALTELGVDVRPGLASFSIPRRAESLLSGRPELAHCTIHPNRDRIDIVPSGIGKGVALRQLLATWDPPVQPVVAIGDGENDLDLLFAAEHGVAVANAVPALRKVAHEVTPGPSSQGFVWLADQLLPPMPEDLVHVDGGRRRAAKGRAKSSTV